jgi:hypothetical protein
MRVSLKNENNINNELNAIKSEDQSIKTEDITKSLLAMKTRDNSERVSIKPEFNNNSYKHKLLSILFVIILKLETLRPNE